MLEFSTLTKEEGFGVSQQGGAAGFPTSGSRETRKGSSLDAWTTESITGEDEGGRLFETDEPLGMQTGGDAVTPAV